MDGGTHSRGDGRGDNSRVELTRPIPVCLVYTTAIAIENGEVRFYPNIYRLDQELDPSSSRHMYGDAADVFVDSDGDGLMDDLDGDGAVTIQDARVLYAVVEAVERRHADLADGLSVYATTTAHGPFVHVDARGVRARW